MTLDDTDNRIREICSILESIANNYPADSKEWMAIRDAAAACSYVQQHKALKNAFHKFLLATGGKLTEEMKNDLRRHGIEPDDLEDDE
jgi:hypothetical protein